MLEARLQTCWILILVAQEPFLEVGVEVGTSLQMGLRCVGIKKAD
jgi:hypothetical protein